VWQERETEEGQGSRQLGVGGDQDWAVWLCLGLALGLLGFWALDRQQCSTVQYCMYCTVLYACMHDANANVGLGWSHPQLHHEA
jgi:hypothetical protein